LFATLGIPLSREEKASRVQVGPLVGRKAPTGYGRLQKRRKIFMSVLTHPLVVDTTKCTGCQICEVACSLAKENICNPRLSRIRILRQDMLGVYSPVIYMGCDLCGQCVTLCPTEAIRFVELDQAALLRKNMGIESFICSVIPGKCESEDLR